MADAVLYMANLPLTANVQLITVLATAMPFMDAGSQASTAPGAPYR